MPIALITGITGQDGSYLAEFLLGKGYEVHGTVRRSSTRPYPRIEHLLSRKRVNLHSADLEDFDSVREVVLRVLPDELYHLGAQTQAGLSFEMAEETCNVVGLGTVRLLEAVRQMPRFPKLFHASSSQVFGNPESSPQNEETAIRPANPYGCAKAFAMQMVSIYRQKYGLFASNGILYNHESPRRGANFVTQKICVGAAAIRQGRQQELVLGSLASKRDWGDARDYVRGMWLSLQHAKGEDFIFATGELHSVEEVLDISFGKAGLDWRNYVKQDTNLLRSDEPTRPMVGSADKAKRLLNWEPSTQFRTLIEEMTEAALAKEGVDT